MSEGVLDPFRPPADRPRGTDREIRQFSAIGAALVSGLATRRYFLSGPDLLFMAGAAFSAGLLVAGLVAPRGVRPVFHGLVALTAPIGAVVSMAILAGLYYGVFLPLGLVFVGLRRDALRLRRPSPGDTLWQPFQHSRDLRRYLRQF
jgi:hypothetical protein